tara:strand:- start:227 stop:391 length:165 start_codon:yes stop_codon:yes gene_type:complete
MHQIQQKNDATSKTTTVMALSMKVSAMYAIPVALFHLIRATVKTMIVTVQQTKI